MARNVTDGLCLLTIANVDAEAQRPGWLHGRPDLSSCPTARSRVPCDDSGFAARRRAYRASSDAARLATSPSPFACRWRTSRPHPAVWRRAQEHVRLVSGPRGVCQQHLGDLTNERAFGVSRRRRPRRRCSTCRRSRSPTICIPGYTLHRVRELADGVEAHRRPASHCAQSPAVWSENGRGTAASSRRRLGPERATRLDGPPGRRREEFQRVADLAGFERAGNFERFVVPLPGGDQGGSRTLADGAGLMRAGLRRK